MTDLVKVFGCRQAYENRPCTNPRDCGDGLWGFRILPIRDDGEAGSAAEWMGVWWVRCFTRRSQNQDLIAADTQPVCPASGDGRIWRPSPKQGRYGVR
jgi:hypothetical protein